MVTDGRMDEEDVVRVHNKLLISHKKKEGNLAICDKMDGRRHCAKWSKSDRARQTLCDTLCIY